MRNFHLFILAITISTLASAQTNNPLNYKGNELVKSLDLIFTDYNAGKINDFDENTINSYSKKIFINNRITMDVVGETINSVKSKSFSEVLKQSTLSKFSKDILSNANSSKKSLAQLVTEVVSNNTLSKIEKDGLLTYLAIINALQTYTVPNRGPCTINGGSGPGACTIAGAGIGFIIGNAACGPPCGIGGIIVGAIIGSTTD